MNISVAVLASLSNTGKYGLDVTLSTLHGLMHTAQRVAGLIVIELGNRSSGSPRVGGMAVLAREGKISVRTMGAHGVLRVREPRTSGERKENRRNQIEHAPKVSHFRPWVLICQHLKKVLRQMSQYRRRMQFSVHWHSRRQNV